MHHDPDWVLDAITRLTDMHEQRRETPWAVTDAPRAFIDQQLKALVGIEMAVEDVQAVAKYSQNRPTDHATIAAGLSERGHPSDHALALEMDRHNAATP